MAKKKVELEEPAKPVFSPLLEKTDRREFVRQLSQRGMSILEYEKFYEDIRKAIVKARTDTFPMMSKKQLAEKLGVSRSTVDYLETGKRRPSTFNLLMLAHATGKRIKITLE